MPVIDGAGGSDESGRLGGGPPSAARSSGEHGRAVGEVGTPKLLREHPHDEPVEHRRHLRRDLDERLRLLEEDLGEDTADVVASERRRAGDATVKNAAEREDVGAGVDVFFAAGLLGRHVTGRADRDAGERQLGRGPGRDPEVDELDPVDVAVDEERVSGLQIAVNDAVRVRLGERVGELGGDGDRVLDREHDLGDLVRERHPVDPLHRQVRSAVLGQPVMDVADDCGVTERGEQRRLALEALIPLGALAVEDLEGDRHPGEAVDRAEHRAHRAIARGPLDREPPGDDIARLHARRIVRDQAPAAQTGREVVAS